MWENKFDVSYDIIATPNVCVKRRPGTDVPLALLPQEA